MTAVFTPDPGETRWADIGFYFSVMIDGLTPLGDFIQVEPVGRTLEPFQYQEGGRELGPHTLYGPGRYNELVLRWGLMDRLALWSWIDAVKIGTAFRKNGAIYQLSRSAEAAPVRVYSFTGAWPVSWTGPRLNSLASEMPVEEIRLAIDSLSVTGGTTAGAATLPASTLVKGMFQCMENGALSLTVPFNPTSFKVGRSVRWSVHPATAQPTGTFQFTSGDKDTLDLQLLLDTSETTASVLPMSQIVHKWSVPAPIAAGVSRPPLMLFSWGTFYFQGVVTTANIDYRLFDASGLPRRALVDVSLIGRAFAQGMTSAQFFGQTTAGG